jgi:hypothetical protein
VFFSNQYYSRVQKLQADSAREAQRKAQEETARQEAIQRQHEANKRVRKETNQHGDSYLPLAYLISSPAPVRYACYGHLVDWFPKSPEEWTRSVLLTTQQLASSASSGYPQEVTFCFTLNVFDGTFLLPVVLYGKDAEEFLGTTASNFHRNKELQQMYLDRFHAVQKEKKCLDFYVQSFVTEKQPPVAIVEEETDNEENKKKKKGKLNKRPNKKNNKEK